MLIQLKSVAGHNRIWFKVTILCAFVVAAVIAILPLDPIQQDELYHEFSDQRTILQIPNFWNTITNIPFLVIGIVGLRFCFMQMPRDRATELRGAYATFFAGVTLIAFGSVYYHLYPSTQTLVWDRLPMSVAFMSLLAVVIGESISPRLGRRLLVPLLVAGLVAVIQWAVSETRGLGDLRFYVLVQFLPAVLIPLILLMFGAAWPRSGYLWAILVTYALAKVAEQFDAALLEATGVLSGHSIKHLLSGLATFWMLPALTGRRRLDG